MKFLIESRREPTVFGLVSVGLLTMLSPLLAASDSEALERYVGRPDHHYNWKQTETRKEKWGVLTRIELVSQHWRDQFWSHHLVIVRPHEVRHADIAFVFVTGDGDGRDQLEILKTLAERSGALAAVITKVPNQPLYGGRKEDALIAHTFDQYLKSGDDTWPLLFPMVKSVVRAMDTMQAVAQTNFQQKLTRFVVGGASKRGWTTWLTSAADPRVVAIAPMVIDMLNMKVQLEWSEKVYGKQSEQIHDYTELNLHQKMDQPNMRRLRSWVDPYAYRERYRIPKLLLLGTNDPYWTVDALRHYWDDLLDPKLIFQTPNAGHDLAGGKEATETLSAYYQMIAEGAPLPKMTWKFSNPGPQTARLVMSLDQKPQGARLWTAVSADRDFRDDKWSSRELTVNPATHEAEATLETPAQGYRAYLGEFLLRTASGINYRLSTEARVTPDGVREAK
jgi:PhoPQ-activated pathogenicity-related protein